MRRRLVGYGLVGSSLIGASARTAVAEPCEETLAEIAIVVGVDLAPVASVFGGIEVRRCMSDVAEALVRLDLNFDAPRLIAGVRARPTFLGAEAGVVLDTRARLGGHLAASLGPSAAYLAAQVFFPLTDTERPQRLSLLGGLAPWSRQLGPTGSPGRPLIHHGEVVRPAVLGWETCPGSAEARAVRDHFAISAQLELSSVWTFLRLAVELVNVGAPAALVAAALDAADDEVRHAELCGAAAGGLALTPLPYAAARPRFITRSPQALVTLAAEAWSEGCLGEAAAAEEARLAGSEATGPVRSMLASIAHDEARHAELSWAVLSWVFSIAPAAAIGAIASARPQATHHASSFDAALAQHGVPSPRVQAAARAHAAELAWSRLTQLAS